MTAPGRTAYDEAAIGPGPTVDAILAGTLGGACAAAALSSGGPGAALAPTVAALVAGGWAGHTDPLRWPRQAATAGLLVAAWAAAATSLRAGQEAALVRLTLGLEAVTMDAAVLADHALAGGWSAAVARTTALLIGAVVLGFLGGASGSRIRPRAPRPLDPWLLDHARRLGLGTAALAALLPTGLRPLSGPDGLGALVAVELAFHAVCAGLALLVARAAWRLPRTAPETPPRIAADALFLLVLVGALAAGRAATGGPWPAWAAPLTPWGAGIVGLALSGRPKPPPRPPHGAAPLPDAAAFAGLVVGVVLLVAAVRLAPALVGPLTVDPWSATLTDPTAEPPPAQALLDEGARVVRTGGGAIAALATGLALATWLSRRVAAAWTQPRTGAGPSPGASR